jgi:hypothetical protein
MGDTNIGDTKLTVIDAPIHQRGISRRSTTERVRCRRKVRWHRWQHFIHSTKTATRGDTFRHSVRSVTHIDRATGPFNPLRCTTI